MFWRNPREILEDETNVAPLVSLGLTSREAQVLFWITQGKTNPEIGVILGTAPGTIRKHVEHILRKLHVENRTAAAAIAFAVCSQLLDLI